MATLSVVNSANTGRVLKGQLISNLLISNLLLKRLLSRYNSYLFPIATNLRLSTFLPLQGGDQEGDGVVGRWFLPHPHPDPHHFDSAQYRLEREGDSVSRRLVAIRLLFHFTTQVIRDWSRELNNSKYIFSSYEKFVIAILASLQFTVVLDFMVLSPLGAILMPRLGISTSQFGLVVSAYAFSAGASGFMMRFIIIIKKAISA